MSGADVADARSRDIPPLSHAEAARVLTAISEVRAVLIGGQAVNFWARLLDDPALDMADMLLTSKDIDFEDQPDQARVCARLLGGHAKTFRPPSLTSAEVYFRDSDGYPRVIDFLTSPGGVDGKEVMETAVPITITETGAGLLVMLASMHWRVYRDPAAGIATSDHPVVFLNAEAQLTTESPLANENIDAAFVALTPTALLVGSWQRGPDHVIQDAPSGLVAGFNLAVLAQADAHFIEPPTFALLPTETPPLPGIDLTRDSERIAAAKGALRITANAPDAAQLAMAIWADGTYRLRATFQTPGQPGGQN